MFGNVWKKPGGLYSPWGRKELDTTKQLSMHACEDIFGCYSCVCVRVCVCVCVCVCVRALLASGGERAGMVLTSFNAQDSPQQEKYPVPSAKCAEVEKYCLSISTS